MENEANEKGYATTSASILLLPKVKACRTWFLSVVKYVELDLDGFALKPIFVQLHRVGSGPGEAGSGRGAFDRGRRLFQMFSANVSKAVVSTKLGSILGLLRLTQATNTYLCLHSRKLRLLSHCLVLIAKIDFSKVSFPLRVLLDTIGTLAVGSIEG